MQRWTFLILILVGKITLIKDVLQMHGSNGTLAIARQGACPSWRKQAWRSTVEKQDGTYSQ